MDGVALPSGSLIGRYRIEREIGRGGMATVFLAHDERHDRRVAVKVFDLRIGDAHGARRFLDEILITARLQHPNIVPLYDSGEENGVLFYVMPYLEGESLRARLSRETQLPVDDAIRIGTEIAVALEHAHRAGTVHRDIKPANVLLNDGRAMVADFGIALAMSRVGADRLTQTGVSIGTPQYMSPEQATDEPVIDARSDVYSLGAVVYEMLTGDPPHIAGTTQGVIAKILTEPASRTKTLRPSVPIHVDEAIARALAKLPADRWQSAAAFAAALAGATAIAPRRRIIVSRSVVSAVTALGVVALAGMGWMWRNRLQAHPTESVSFVLEPPADLRARGGEIGDVAISEDGKLLAYVVAWDTAAVAYVRRVDEAVSRRVPHTEGALFLSFSPNGQWLAVQTADRRLLKVVLNGSSPLTLSEHYWSYGGPTWESDESLILYGPQLNRISAQGGDIRPVTARAAVARPRQGYAVIDSDHETVVFGLLGPAFTDDDVLAIGSLRTGEYHATSLLMNRPIGIVDKHIVYVTATGVIKAVPFDARTQRVTGDARRIMEGLAYDIGNAKMSATVTLVYRTGRRLSRLVLEKDGRRSELLSNIEGAQLTPPRVSRDGRHVVFNMVRLAGDTLASDIWMLDRASRGLTRLTSFGDVESPAWTLDGTAIVYATWFNHNPTIRIQRVDASTPARVLARLADGGHIDGVDVAGHSAITLCAMLSDHDASALYYLPVDRAAQPERVDQRRGCSDFAQVSPDGIWLATDASDGGATNVYVQPFRRAGTTMAISVDGGQVPRWSRDGRSLYFVHPLAADNSGTLMRVQLRFANGRVTVIRRDSIAPMTPGSLYDVALDGSVVRIEPIPWANQVVVKTNWLPELRARLR